MYTYFYKFRACVKEAYEDKLFAGNPILRVKRRAARRETHSEFMTLEELGAVYSDGI
jgi:hypothetical protein